MTKPQQKYSVFFGDVAEDEYYAAPFFPSAGDKLIVKTLPPQYGGMIANAASIFAHYGMATTFISQLNSGPLTQKLLRQLREAGLNTDYVIFDEAVPDSKCIILISGDQHIVIIPKLGITHSEITPQMFEHIAGAEFLFTSLTDARPFRMGELTAPQVLQALRRRGVKIVMDLDVYNLENHPSGLIEYCDILFMNSRGKKRFTSVGNDIQQLLAAGATAIVVTKDSEGCDLHTAKGVKSIPGYKVEVVDVTGAGDTFSSSFLYAYSQSGDLAAAAEFANAAAALSVGKVGARGGMTTDKAVRAFMQERAVLV
ncbi:carbohydrate kinase family protein [Aestuariivirga sp. YIM B02566]|uniref:Carbohydrate kinase family protein n=1 Tax=Taklimakanibacter albus TaxID=2800327 RepID=A0ACC5R5H0_9HYPH|nr:carbohydrate kinase family protein [Aestuariivirga sp. YIM B02566]MBK1867889.1 carbohydrate kinase family protein [Aestuariivirga sp. YIM B02566]